MRNVWRDKSLWLTVLLVLLGVLAPVCCVLWFMNEAVRAQSQAARQSVADAYRSQLRFVRDQIDANWEKRTAELKRQLIKATPAEFAAVVRSGYADSVVFTEDAPVSSAEDPVTVRSDWQNARNLEARQDFAGAIYAWGEIAKSENDPSLAARAAQAKIRLLLRSKGDVLPAIDGYFAHGRLMTGRDLTGRLIAADEQLLAIHLISSTDRNKRLAAMLNDYERVAMPSAQRLFLMDELRTLAPGTAFPTCEAEKLAAEFREQDDARAGFDGLQASRVAGVWKLQLGPKTIALYRQSTIAALMRKIVDDNKGSSAADYAVLKPGEQAAEETVSLGAALPGWQVALRVPDSAIAHKAFDQQRVAYLWTGYLAAACIALAGLLAAGAFRRQQRLARLKTDLIAAVSHELRTPLASMRVLVDSLLEERNPDARKTREYLQLISGENIRLTRLIENFLTFSRIERRRQPLEFREADGAEIARSATRLVRERMVGSDFALDLEAESQLAIYGDSDAIVTVLLNLLDNACRYTPDKKSIRLRAFTDSDSVVFAVQDNGVGIAVREQKKIFRPFYQVDRRLAREIGGCGLGLSIVDFLVRAHGGEVKVESTPGEGSTFSVYLPVASRARKAAA